MPHFSPTNEGPRLTARRRLTTSPLQALDGRVTATTHHHVGPSWWIPARASHFSPLSPLSYLTSHTPPATMPPSPPKLLPPNEGPRLIVYHQTIHDPDGNYNSLLPLLTNNTGITHIIVAAIHLNDGPGNITLNDHRPDDKRHDQLWGEVKWVQGSGVKVLGMLGGAAKGSFERLSGSDEDVCIPSFIPLPAYTCPCVPKNHN